MADIGYQDVTTTLLTQIPELKSDYDAEAREWQPDAVHPHVVYGSVFARFIGRVESQWETTNDGVWQALLKRCFALVEQVATSSDFESRCVIEASLLESLLGEPGGWSRFGRFFGPNTKRMAEEVRRRFEGSP